MKNYKYKYVNPKDIGYKKIKVSKKLFNSAFKYRRIPWYSKIDVWYKEETNDMICEEYKNLYFIILATIALPFICLLCLMNSKETILEYLSLFNQKKKGKHRSDSGFRESSKKILRGIK